MKHLGAIIIDHQSAGALAGLLPWKELTLEDIISVAAGLPVSGLYFLSTCNRVEILYSVEDASHHSEIAHEILSRLPEPETGPMHLTGHPVARHFIRLACGLESMVLGETEIRHQMKEAMAAADKAGLLGRRIRLLLEGVFRESRYIRQLIPGNIPLSIASLAARELEDSLGGVGTTEDAIVVIGSGPMSRHTMEYLHKWGASNIVFVNRTVEKIRSQAERTGGRVLSFDEFISHPEAAGAVRAIVTATSRPDAFISKPFVSKLLNAGSGKLTVVDLALPNDAEPDISDLPGLSLITLDSIREKLERNKRHRQQAAEGAQEAVEEALYRIETDMIQNHSGPLIRELQKDIRDRAKDRLERLLNGRLAHLSRKDRQLLYDWAIRSHREMNRIHRKGVETILKNYFAN